MPTELILLPRVSYRGQEVTSPRLGSLLALLATEPRAGHSAGRLIDGLWPDEQPENPTKALQILVSRARSQLGPELIASTPTGYRLALDENEIDAAAVLRRASASAQRARAGDHASALAEAEAGLELFEGFVGQESVDGDDALSTLRSQRRRTWQSLRRSRALALSRLGRSADAIDVLTALVDEQPRDEELLLEMLRSQSAVLGPSLALERYEGYRRDLRDQLGADPGPALQALQRELLLATTPSIRHGVPHEPNQLLGRDADLAAVTGLLRTSRVVSIVGPGGLGKTRLANAVSRAAEQRMVQVVPLAGVSGDDGVLTEVAAALGVGEARRGPIALSAPGDLVAGIVAALGSGSALLVLDNCEQVVRGVADLVRVLISSTGEARVLTTSRTPLGLSSESVYLLPELDNQTAAELFAQRATAARPSVELPPALVDEITSHLDGLPLAVELAAARVRTMSVGDIARRLGDRFALLRGGGRDAPERHRTLEAVVDWSWNLLSPAGQEAMRALSVFPSGFTAEAAAELVGDDTALEELVDQSLLRVIDTPAGARFRMLETVREFSAARRSAAGDEERVTEAFLAWARAFGVAQHETLFGPRVVAAADMLRAEQENLWYAYRIALQREDGASVAAAAAVLEGIWMLDSNYGRMAALGVEAGWLLSHYRPAPDMVDATRTALVLCGGYVLLLEGPRANRALVALRRLPPAPHESVVGAAQVLLNDVDDPGSLARLSASDEPMVAAAANGVMTYVWENQGDLERALDASEQMITVFESRDVPWLRAVAHARSAELCLQLERAADAIEHLRITLPVYERIGSKSEVDGLRWWMVLAHLQAGDIDEAERWLDQTTADRVDDDTGTLTYGLASRAEILLARGKVDEGLALWRRAEEILSRITEHLDRTDPAALEPWVLEARAVDVIAHVRHGRPELVETVAAGLPAELTRMFAHPTDRPPPYLMEVRLGATILLAIATLDLHNGRSRRGAQLTALAERLRYLRLFQPTMAPERARSAAGDADRSAYDDAVSSYADLDFDALRAIAVDLVAQAD